MIFRIPDYEKGEFRLSNASSPSKNNWFRTIKILVFSLLLAALFSVNSYAWNDSGHMMVALIAYQKLTLRARTRVDALVAMNPKIKEWRSAIPQNTSDEKSRMMLFMIAATWADQIRADPKYRPDGSGGGTIPPSDKSAAQNIGYDDTAMHKYWHFIDVPIPTDRPALRKAYEPNVETQIVALRIALASRTLSDSIKSFDLVWLIHLVGDIHQPLHTVSRFGPSHPEGDKGGSGVDICLPKCGSLHNFWDNIFGSNLNLKTGLESALNTVNDIPVPPSSQSDDLTVRTWRDESVETAETKVYGKWIEKTRIIYKLQNEYRIQAVATAKVRVGLAGARLAKILNSELDTGNMIESPREQPLKPAPASTPEPFAPKEAGKKSGVDSEKSLTRIKLSSELLRKFEPAIQEKAKNISANAEFIREFAQKSNFAGVSEDYSKTLALHARSLSQIAAKGVLDTQDRFRISAIDGDLQVKRLNFERCSSSGRDIGIVVKILNNKGREEAGYEIFCKLDGITGNEEPFKRFGSTAASFEDTLPPGDYRFWARKNNRSSAEQGPIIVSGCSNDGTATRQPISVNVIVP